MTTTASSTPPWNAHSHHSRQSQPVTPSRTRSAKRPLSSHSAMPPFVSQERRTPVQPPPPDPTAASPNYFTLAVDTDKDCFTTSGANRVRANWGSASSNIRSLAAASPRPVSPDQPMHFADPEPQTEANPFSLGGLADTEVIRSQTPRSSRSVAGSVGSTPVPVPSEPAGGTNKTRLGAPMSPRNASIAAREAVELQIPRSPKRMLSEDSVNVAGRIRRESPASFTDHGSSDRPDMSSRRSLSSRKHTELLASAGGRADTLPSPADQETASGPVMVSPQHVVGLMKQGAEDVLLLDIRVVTQYAKSRVSGALNLCIPTTLLKRATFNVQKLTDTFKDNEQRNRFERWRHARYIIVYDENSSQIRDAKICVNTLKKFEREGWSGSSYIIRGGFKEFSSSFPALIVHDQETQKQSSVPHVSIISPAPSSDTAVIGGCPMPPTRSAANPFFGNIRQNMDLIGGVGQLPVKHPASLTSLMESQLPQWLRQAVDEKDEGKIVSEKFLQIERGEQKRMQEALSSNVVYGAQEPADDASEHVQIAGIEKGSKNRYNNIWPYEHSRVKLQGVSSSGCDYINANFVQSSFSTKRYIATQGPMPSTFNDFWNVVWQQDVRVIVMLTAEKEGGLLKAHNYWSDKRYGHLDLNFHSEHRASLEPAKILRHRDSRQPSGNSNNAASHNRSQTLAARPPKDTHPRPVSRSSNTTPMPHGPGNSPGSTKSPLDPDQPFVVVRKFTLSNSREPFARMREITQLQYSSWPDFGAPAHPAHLLGLVEQCDSVVRASSGRSPSNEDPDADIYARPMVVHCSAGCGRTGTFCTVDSVVDALRRQRGRRLEQERQKQSRNMSFSIDWTMPDAPLGRATPSASASTPSSAVASPAVERKRSVAFGLQVPRTPPAVSGPFSSQQSDSFDFSFSSPSGGNKIDEIVADSDGDARAAHGEGGEQGWLERDDIDLVERTVQDFRLQRLSMVQSLRQFVLCYESVLEWLVVQQPRTA